MSFIVDAFNQVASQKYVANFDKQASMTASHFQQVKQSGSQARKLAALRLIQALKQLYTPPEPIIPRVELKDEFLVN
jgi:hypothetical protein